MNLLFNNASLFADITDSKYTDSDYGYTIDHDADHDIWMLTIASNLILAMCGPEEAIIGSYTYLSKEEAVYDITTMIELKISIFIEI